LNKSIIKVENDNKDPVVKLFCSNEHCPSWHNGKGRYLATVKNNTDIEILCPVCKTINFAKIKF